MNRRTFLIVAGIGLPALTTCLESNPAAYSAVKKPAEHKLKNWVWITINTNRTDDDWKRLFATVRESGVKAILPEIYDGRNAYFPSQRLPVKTDVLSRILPLAHAEDLEVHAWMWSMPCMVEEIMTRHPDWYNVNEIGRAHV